MLFFILMTLSAMYASLGVTRRQFGISCTGMLLTSCGVKRVNGEHMGEAKNGPDRKL